MYNPHLMKQTFPPRIKLLCIGIVSFVIFFGVLDIRSASATTAPALPQTYINTTYPTLSITRTIRSVKSSCTGVSNCYLTLQSAIDAAILGDEIVVDYNLAITGPITLKNKTAGTGWIVIRTSALSSLPPAGSRVGPSYASSMPKIEAPGSNVEALRTENNAHNYRIVGIEFREKTPNDDTNVLVQLGNGNSQCATATEPYKVCDTSVLATYASNIILDRIYAHGDRRFNTKRGVALDSKSSAVIDSYISDIQTEGQDSQAIAGFNGPGPYKIVNNYLEGAGENIIFGGDDPRVLDLRPSDIEIRGNYFYKPLTWRYGDATYNGRRWQVKNLFELKNAARVSIDGNIFENIWGEAQDGTAILFNSTNQYGRCVWCEVSDITFTNNILRHAAGAISIQANDYEFFATSNGITKRINIFNNLLYDIDGTKWKDLRDGTTGIGMFLHMTATKKDGANDVEANHNTVIHAGRTMNLTDCLDIATNTSCSSSTTATNKNYAQKSGFTFTNNVTFHSTYGVWGESTTGIDNAAMLVYLPGAVFTKNIITGQRSSTDTRDWSSNYSSYPGNYFPKSITDIGFVDAAAADYRLSSTSLYKAKASDGKDVGADIDVINTTTSGVISGSGSATTTPPPPPTTGILLGDINGDKIVNAIDWSIMNSKWFTSDATCDLNQDGVVNTLDYSILNSNWFKTGV